MGLSFSYILEKRGRRRIEDKRIFFLKLMSMKMEGHHMVAVRLNDPFGTKRKYTFINKVWLPKILFLWIMIMVFASRVIYDRMDAENKERRKEVLVSMCDQRARMLQDQFNVSVNHVHALAVLVSTFHYYKNPSAIDQVCVTISPSKVLNYLSQFYSYFDTVCPTGNFCRIHS